MVVRDAPGGSPLPSDEALFRYFVVSQVRAATLGGVVRAEAVAAAARQTHYTPAGRPRGVSARTIYRWLAAHTTRGLAGLEPRSRQRTQTSCVLSERLLEFLREARAEDTKASVPELIRRAQVRGIIESVGSVDRATVWRACKRMGLPTSARTAKRDKDMRRFAFPHRMMMVLCDGKHFRAGPQRSKRLALFFLDDATRKALHVIVGTSETALLFLTGVYECIRKHGLPTAAFTDNGSGFISDDAQAVFASLDVPFIQGTPRYPEGRGKIERFNRTAIADVLRGLDGAVGLDDSSASLTLRLQHYLDHEYNPRGHSSLGGESPQARWAADSRPLRFPQSEAALRAKFVVRASRTVSADNVISYEGTSYEVPRGHARTRIIIQRGALDGALHILHDGRLVRLEPVDLSANAYARRARADDTPDEGEPAPTTAAAMAFQRDFGPVVGPDGGFIDPKE